MDKKDKRKKILKVSGLIGLFLIVFGLSYALFTITLNGTKKVKISTGRLELQLLDSNNNPIYITDQNNTTSYEINLDNQVPVSDEVGLDTQAFEFKLKNSGSVKASYTIYLDDVALETGESRIDDQYIRYSLTKNGSEDEAKDLTDIGSNPNRKLDKGTIEADNTINTYTLKIWIAEDATNEAMDKVFNATLRVEGTQYVSSSPSFPEGSLAAVLYSNGPKMELTSVNGAGFDPETEQAGLYKYTDADDTITYIYRGDDVNNYVTFADQTWRILRIQSDGTVKLIRNQPINYVDTNYVTSTDVVNGVNYTKTIYNDEDDYVVNNNYIGSNVEGYVDSWYESTMTSYDNKIATNNYCSDRTEDKNSAYYNILINELDWEYDHDLFAVYGVWNRFSYTNWDGLSEPTEEQMSSIVVTPSVSCRNEDKVSKKTALITADEYILAGNGVVRNNCYLCGNDTYWTMSPSGYVLSAYAMAAGNYLVINEYLSNSYGVRPVITLKANTTIASGDGTVEHPYVIE